MLRIQRDQQMLQPMDRSKMADAGLLERSDLQQLIRQNAEVFFREIAEDLLLIGEEVRPSDVVEDRIDLLAVDKNGGIVVVELKRGRNKLQLLQAISYAAMISKWELDQIVDQFGQFDGSGQSNAQEVLEEFLDCDLADINQGQRILLFAEAFEMEVLASAEWLSEKYDVDIHCIQLELALDQDQEYLSCKRIFPLPELQDLVKHRARMSKRTVNWESWEQVLETCKNTVIQQFFREELQAGRENYLRKKHLIFRIQGKRRYRITLRKENCHVYQLGRFSGDTTFWQKRLGAKSQVEQVTDGARLRFWLMDQNSLEQFRLAYDGELQEVEFLNKGKIEENGK